MDVSIAVDAKGDGEGLMLAGGTFSALPRSIKGKKGGTCLAVWAEG